MEPKTGNVPSGRVLSIDALRGFDMFWIIGGDVFFKSVFRLFNRPFADALVEQLDHSAWHGFTFYDLIFPLFLFIVGLSMPFAIGRRKEKGHTKKEIFGHIIKRALTLLVLGLIYNGLFDLDFAHYRYTGVLHRIAICYFIAAVITLNVGIKMLGVIAGSILLVYWGIMMLIPVPGFGAGVLTPEGNLAGYLDRLLLPGSFCCYGFGDNEGILSTLPSVATTLLGVITGCWLRSLRTQKKKVLWMIGAGVLFLVLARVWDLVFPINKLIWSSSYVLYTAGWSLLLLSLFYWIIDMKGYHKWAFPFVVIGLNPITIYVAQSLFDFSIISDIFIHGFVFRLGIFSAAFGLLCAFLVKWYFLYFLYKQKIFLKA
ncbi:DUF5009 domain-containing protein [candidate division KSB1 bacterium]|nr:DUF5009 domain-containing protein [candidate division KSB1 bacterium]